MIVTILRRVNCYAVCFGFGLSVLIILTGTRYAEYTYHRIGNQKSTRNFLKVEHGVKTFTHGHDVPPYINKLLNSTRTKIKNELHQYNFSESGARVLEDLIMETGGRPLQSLIISTWRSGTTFLGEVLKSIPGTFYHYEPFHIFGVTQIRGSPNADEAISVIRDMFKCNFEDLEEYLLHAKNHMIIQLTFNTELWYHCEHEIELCSDKEFTSHMCRLFPFQTMKVVRLRLRFIKEILDDKELNVKAILLIRDPRSVMLSRQLTDFCQPVPDCWDPSLVCADMISDYVAAGRLLHQYPNRLMVLRFEELALQPNITGQRILKFLRLSATQWLDKFIQSHTNKEEGGISSTFRVSRDVPFRWKNASNFTDVDEIQILCKQAMLLWGYKMAHNESHMKSDDFNPIGDYIIRRV